MRAGSFYFLLATTLVLAPAAQRPAFASWPPLGRALCTASGLQGAQAIATDGAGGAIVTWQDRRSLPFNIYTQHVQASGQVDAAWPTDGRALMTDPLMIPSVPEGEESPEIVSDGAGGAIVTWADGRIDLNGSDIFAQHVLASGTVDGAWPSNGSVVCAAAGDQNDPVIVSDGAGGAIVIWVDGRPGATVNDRDVYAQHLLASGLVDPSWPANGTPVCTEPKAQGSLAIIGDGGGGAIVTWSDSRSGNPGVDIYAQHVLSSGVVDPLWPANGRALCTAPGTQAVPRIISDGGDGTHGAIVTWHDLRDGINQIYAQRILASSAIASGWPDNGRALAPSGFDEVDAAPVSDGAGGAIVAWSDARNGFLNVRAQHVLPSGVVDAAWPDTGTMLSIAATGENFPAIASDGVGGAIVTWQASFDIFAQHVLGSGALDSAYPANGRPLCDLPSLQHSPAIVAAGAGGAIVTWMDRRDGVDDIYALQVLAAGTTDVDPGTRPSEISFSPASPNPARVPITLRFALPREERVRLAIYDVSGRRVRELASGARPAGEQAIAWDLRDGAGNSVGAGLYFARLEVEGRTLTQKLATVK
jgi:hypothetical protein